jgi:hypothetical protein
MLLPVHATCQVLPPSGPTPDPARPPPAWLEAALYSQHPRGSSFVFDSVVVRPWSAAAATGVVASDERYAWEVHEASVRVLDGATGEVVTMSPDAALADWRSRGLRADARAHQRWREKCVHGRYVPSPELSCDAPEAA